ncbi:MAG TPA: phosphatidate cytidylyltransferase [Caulobacteraceae bacterium]
MGADLTTTPSFDWRNFAIRAASGLVLAAAALGAIWVYNWPHPLWRAPFLVMISIGAVLLSIEWSAMASPRAGARVTTVMSVAVVGVVLLAFVGQFALAWSLIGLGAIAAALAVGRGGDRAIDAAYGVLYIAPACLVLVWLAGSAQGSGWTLMLFACTWAADSCAFIVGNALKGPLLWPRWSPKKTWSGFFGGLVGATVASVGVAAAFMRLSLVGAAVIGLIVGLATMGGDLWESMLKRRYGVKDTGALIPGHGGLLDRVDGLMFAVMVVAAARLIVHVGFRH